MTRPNRRARGVLTAFTAAGILCGAQGAEATNGYFTNGLNPQQKAMAGAGTAIDTGVLGMALNPAMGASTGNQAEACIAAFSPDRSVDTGMGIARSNNQFFPVPCGGANWQLDSGATLGFVVYGNGGMNTEYDMNFFGGTGPLGVDLMQLFISPTWSKPINDTLTVGVAPVFAIQGFRAYGLDGFAGMSTNPTALTNNGTDWSFGAGLNLGVTWQPNESFTLGVAYRSRIFMSKFDDYAGLFAEQGDFDIPAQLTIAAAFQASEALTLTAEYQHIWYSDVAAIGNMFLPNPLGADNGPGFGWKDMDVFRLAAAYQVNDELTLRGGVSYATEFIDASQVQMNTLAPATPQWHLGLGATWQMDQGRSLSVSYTRALNHSIAGTAVPMSIRMDQHELAVGMTWAW